MLKSVKVGSVRSFEVTLVGVFESTGSGNPRLDTDTKSLDGDGAIADAVKRPDCRGKSGELTEVVADTTKNTRRTLILGLGNKSSFDERALHDLAAPIAKYMARLGATSLAVEIGGAVHGAKKDAYRAARALGEGLALMTYDTGEFKGKATTLAERPALKVGSSDSDVVDGLKVGIGLGESANIARFLSQTPPNICNPGWLASQAKKIARGCEGLSVRVIQGKQLEEEGLEGLVNVGKASESPPCLIRMEYTPKSRKRGLGTAVLVGKSMTYDSGGLSIKTGGSMRGMKRDMDGGAGVIGAMHAIATVIKPRRKVVALLASAENSISDEAYRPDDVITFRNGVTCEVTNTDAEGRLVLADALCWACDKENPDFIVDAATLTGGVVVALGSTFAGMWCDDDKLRAKVERAAGASGERVWRLPLHQEYKDLMRSDIADILNSSAVRAAHPIQGAAFLAYFVKEGIPWCHLDIAGVHAHDGEKGPYAKGTSTGFGTRLLADLLDQDA